jgi:hypothetical protein
VTNRCNIIVASKGSSKKRLFSEKTKQKSLDRRQEKLIIKSEKDSLDAIKIQQAESRYLHYLHHIL